MFRSLLITISLAVMAMATLPSLAQSIAGSEVINEVEVISTTRRSEGLADINSAVSVLGTRELNLIALTHYQEALNRIPGVNIHRNNGQESLASIRSPVFTGAGACGAFLVAENGIPLRSSGFCNVNEMFDAHSENAAQIEVVRGPGSAFWGSNAVHGLINVVLPEPGDIGNLRLEAGPRGSFRLRGALGNDYGNFKQTLLVNAQNEEGYRADSGVDQQKMSWLYNYTTDNGTELDGGFTLNNLNQETAGFVVGTNAYKDKSLRKTNPNPEAYRDSASGRAWTRFTRQLDNGELVFTPYWRSIDMRFIQHFLPGQPIEDFEHSSLGLQAAGYRDLANGGQLAVGFDIEETSAALKQFQPNPTRGSFFLRNSIPQGQHYDFEVDARLLAAFVNFDTNYLGWQLSLGLRIENMQYDYNNLMIDGRTDEFGVPCRFGCRYNRPADRNDEFTNLSPKLGLSYALNDNHTLQIRVQRGFRAPQATELYRLQNAQSVADLESVELDSFELAVNGSGAGWDYSASLYHMDKDNGIFQNSARENVNDSSTQHRGFELEIGRDLTESLSIRVVGNYAKHTYENSRLSGGMDINGNDVDTAPNRFGTLRLTWRPVPAVVSELEWVHMGEYFTNPENTVKYEGHDLLNLRTQYTLSEDLLLSLNIMNLSNDLYAERADWTTFTGDRYFPGEELRAFFAVNWNFR
ncbi:MAG: TonB-dependent receptor [Gammaproteobacteria bacterium]|nr:TonB-dependent receptor [Gammaproteobacteria bacterium]